jgi:hypothetical protein
MALLGRRFLREWGLDASLRRTDSGEGPTTNLDKRRCARLVRAGLDMPGGGGCGLLVGGSKQTEEGPMDPFVGRG